MNAKFQSETASWKRRRQIYILYITETRDLDLHSDECSNITEKVKQWSEVAQQMCWIDENKKLNFIVMKNMKTVYFVV